MLAGMQSAVLQSMLITFREGLESFLIVGVILTYLRKTGRAGLVRGVHVGIAISVLTSTVGAYYWYQWLQSTGEGPNQALYEGIAALVAAVLVGGLLWQTLRLGRHLKADIEAKVERVAAKPRARALVGVALITMLLITREGLEAMLFIGVQAFAARMGLLVLGAALGLGAAGIIAWTWTRYSHKLQIGVVLRVTAIFLGIFLVQLLLYGAHELSESGLWANAEGFHNATERFGPDGDIGQYISLSLAGAPLLYLLLSRRSRKPASPAPAVEATPRQAAS